MPSVDDQQGRLEGLASALVGEDDPQGLPLNSTSQALEAAHRVKAGPGVLLGFTVTSTKVAAQFVLAFDQRDQPANNAVPAAVFAVAAGSTVFNPFGAYGRAFQLGIWLANSSTAGVLTNGSADCWFDAQYL